MSYPTVDQIEINAENKESFGQMQNHVCLVAQLDYVGSKFTKVEGTLYKSAKYYYGLQDIAGTIKTMYNKKLPGPRFNTDNANKTLEVVTSVDETTNITDIKTTLTNLFKDYNNKTAGVNTEAYIGLDTLFNTLKISSTLGGARVMLYAKYDKSGDKVNAYGQLLFIKKGEVNSLKLNIKNNVVIIGSGVGDGKSLALLMEQLFGLDELTHLIVKEESNDSNAGMQTASKLKQDKDTAGAGAGAAPDATTTPVAPDAATTPVAPDAATTPVGETLDAKTIRLVKEANDRSNAGLDGGGGKSSQKKRKMSSKKGGRNNSASRKQNKKGGAKIRRSQKAGKRMR